MVGWQLHGLHSAGFRVDALPVGSVGVGNPPAKNVFNFRKNISFWELILLYDSDLTFKITEG